MGVGSVEKQWKNIYGLGAYMTMAAIFGVVVDVVIGSITGGNLEELPQTAVGRFDQLHQQVWLGLYNLDLLNVINQLLLIPLYFALYAIHREVAKPGASLTLIIFLIGTTLFVVTNPALPMLELGNGYQSTSSESQRALLSAAGEAILARGVHGSTGAFISFSLPTLAGVLMSIIMLRQKTLSRWPSYLGIVGNTLMLVYVVLVTFLPGAQRIATALAMPGGLMVLAWMTMIAITLIRLARQGGPTQFTLTSER